MGGYKCIQWCGVLTGQNNKIGVEIEDRVIFQLVTGFFRMMTHPKIYFV